MKQERIHSHNKREGLKCGSLGKVVEEEEEEAIK